MTTQLTDKQKEELRRGEKTAYMSIDNKPVRSIEEFMEWCAKYDWFQFDCREFADSDEYIFITPQGRRVVVESDIEGKIRILNGGRK